MKKIKKCFIKTYKNLKEWRRERLLQKQKEKEQRRRRKREMMLRLTKNVMSFTTSFMISSLGMFAGNAIYDSIMKLKEER